ncbi:MAG: PDZ domain-containing protein [Pyrinomonadaceae bacterium]
MIKKSLGLTLLFSTLGFVAFAQDAPQPNKGNAPPAAPESRQVRGIFFSGMDDQNQSFLGVQMVEINNKNFSSFGLDTAAGVGVHDVVKDSPAEKAGIKKGDVILTFNGEPVTSTRKLSRLINETAPDHIARITVKQSGGEKTFDVVIGKREPLNWLAKDQDIQIMRDGSKMDFPGMPNVQELRRVPFPDNGEFPVSKRTEMFSPSKSIGAQILPLTKQLGELFGVSNGEGVLISEVEKDSPAQKAGLKAGDVITAVDGNAVKRPVDIMKAVSNKDAVEVTITYIRDKRKKDVKVTPQALKGENMYFYEFEDNDSNQDPNKIVKERIVVTGRDN